MNTWIYDLEVYPNYFTGFFKNLGTGEYKQFTDSTLVELCAFLNTPELVLIGFNNGNYDDKILAVILDNPEVTTAELKAHSDAIIEKKNNGVIKSAMIKVRQGKMPWYSIDIKAVTYGQPSLKKQQIKYRWHNVLETPIAFDSHLTEPQKALVDAYCKNDVDSTEFLYNRQENIDRVNLRLELAKKYQYLDGITNINTDSALGGKIMEGEMIRRSGLTKQDIRAIIATKRHHKFYFVGKDDILPSVKFSTPHNQAVLEQLKGVQFEALTKEERAELKLSDPLEHFILKMPVSGDTYKMGEGGAHSKIGAAIATDNIWHADVASYYPSMILNIGKQPMGCPEEWIQIYDNVLTSRLEAKNNGNKAEAQFLKIPLNATYGQMGSRDSMSFDRSSLLRVTVNGQLMILMLCESLELNGHKLLSVNTDGIFFTAGESGIDNARDVVSQWSKDTNLGIDVEQLDAFVSSNVSAYAVMEHGVWTKRNDVFSEYGAKETAAVVSNAVLNHIITGESIDTFIKNCTDIYDFLTPKIIDKRYKAIDGISGEELQGINRIYRSTDGVGIIKRNIATGKESSLASNVTVYNNITSESLPADINYDYYINQAEKWYDKLASSDNVIEKAIPACDRKVSFTITESVGDNRVKPEGQLESTWQAFVDYLSVSTKHKVKEDAGLVTPCKFKYASDTGCKHAFYTKKEAELGRGEYNAIKFNKSGNPYTWKGGQNIEQWYMLPVDIDEDVTIEEAKERFSDYEYVLYSTFSHQLGLNGDKFRILFLLKKPVSSKYLKDRKAPIKEWIGSHDKSSLADFRGFYLPSHGEENKDNVVFYHNTGTLLDLSKFAPVDPKPKKSKTVYEGTNNDREKLLVNLASIGTLEYHDWFALACALKDNGFEYDDFEFLTGYLRAHRTDNDSRGNWDRANEYAECAYDMDWVQRLIDSKLVIGEQLKPNTKVKDISILEPLHEGIEPALREAYDNVEVFGVLQAAPGSGKSTLICDEICIRVMNHVTSHEKVFVVLQGKDHMSQMAESLAERLGTSSFNEYGIYFHEANKKAKYGSDFAVDTIPSNARAVITHFTYAGRWGMSPYVYDVMRFIDSDTIVLIDELDAYINSLQMSLDFGGRAKRAVIGGQIIDEKVHSCRVSNGSGNCSKCMAKHENSVEYRINSAGVPGFIYHDTWTDYSPHKSMINYNYELTNKPIEKFCIGPNEITVLTQSPESAINMNSFHERNALNEIDRDITLSDMFTCAFYPTIHRPFILGENGEVTVEEMRPLMLKNDKYSVENIDRALYRFPQRPCNVLTFTGINRKPFILYRKAKKVVGFSATIAKIHKNFVEELLEGCKFIKIPVAQERKLKKLILVALHDKVTISDIADEKLKAGNNVILKFMPTKKKALLARMELVESGVSAVLADGKLNLTDVQDKTKITKHHIKYFITHAFGSLGRGTNLPEFPIANVDLANYKPTCAYSTDGIGQLLMDMFEVQISTLIQNAGRIFRWKPEGQEDDGVRVIFIENLKSLSDDIKAGFNVGPKDVYDFLVESFSESFDEFEEWLIPEYLAEDVILEQLSYVFTHLKLPSERMVSWEDCIEEVRRNGYKGKVRKDVLKKCSANDRARIQKANDEYVGAIRSEGMVGKVSRNKGKLKDPRKILDGKLKKIDELMSNGLKTGQILSQIGYKKLDDFVKSGIDIHMEKLK